MTHASDRPKKFQIQVNAGHPELLEGLEVWVQLGLLSHAEVLEIGGTQLSCPLPEPVRVAATPPIAEEQNLIDFVPLAAAASPAESPPFPPMAGRLPRLFQTLMAEISVVWLLFLGVFLVVISSGVLAASQWRNVSMIGQYGILLTYTLVFWGATAWTERRTDLRLTARMLRAATLLIIPVNFWTMDGLQLWRNPTGLMLGAIASLILTLMLFRLFTQTTTDLSTLSRQEKLNALALSWLHWGWNLVGVPLVASYVGTIGTVAVLVWGVQRRPQAIHSNAEADPPPPLSLESIVLVGMALLLLARGLLVASLPWSQLGLAFGLCGWLLGWLSLRTQDLWGWGGTGLLILGWLVSVGQSPPWQAIAISGLAAWLLVERLKRGGQRQDLTALFVVGLQAVGLLWLTVPLELRQSVFETINRLSGDRGLPEAIAGVLLFPYLWLMLAIAQRLQRRPHPVLSRHAHLLSLLLGVGMTGLSVWNPLLRSLNLLFSSLTLVWIIRRPLPAPLSILYLTHLTVVAAAIAWLRFLLPDLPELSWTCLLLMAMVAEWGMALDTQHLRWRHTAWHLGLGFAATAYWLLLGAVDVGNWGLVWLVVPVLLTLMAYRPSFMEPLLATWLSVAGVFLVQFLSFTLQASWVVSLGAATGVMLFNTPRMAVLGQSWEAPTAAVIAVGFGLGTGLAVLDQVIEPFTQNLGLNLLSGTSLLLWLLWTVLRRSPSLQKAYSLAIDAWGTALATVAVVTLSFVLLDGYLRATPVPLAVLGATVWLTGAIACRLWQQPTDLGFWGLGWSAYLWVAAGLGVGGITVTHLAIATLVVALLLQLAGDVWVRRSGQPYFSSWHGIPLIYAGLGFLLIHNQFTATTGLYVLVAALVGMGVGRRQPRLRGFTLMALAAVSLAAYELLVYQLLQAEGGSAGDGVALLAGLAAMIAWFYRLGDRWLLPYLQLRRSWLRAIAHLHWLLGSGLLLLALAASLSPTGSLLWMTLGGLLSAYALVMGNHRWSGTGEGAVRQLSDPLPSSPEPPTSSPPETRNPQNTPPPSPLALLRSSHSLAASLWTYAGILQFLVLIAHAFYRLDPEMTWLGGWSGAIASLVAVPMYLLPWQRWGWPWQPWHRTAVVLPGGVILLSAGTVALPVLLIGSATYAWMSAIHRRIRLSYGSVLLLDWAVLRFLERGGLLNPLGVGLVLGGTLLYVAQLDPVLQQTSAREKRHWLRSLAAAIVLLNAYYQAEIAVDSTVLVGFNLLTLGLSLVFVVLGLLLRIRAFLYIGTLSFILQVLRQVWLFLDAYPFLLWAIGIVLGLLLIWTAATFEARRTQVNTWVQHWLTELQRWQ